MAVERNLEILLEILRRYCELVRFDGSSETLRLHSKS